MAKCYDSTGTEEPNFFPCDVTAAGQGKHTSCCGKNLKCLTNGMCRNQEISDATNFEWLGGCTDASFADPACGKYCGADAGLAWQCKESDTYCCHTGAIPKYNDRNGRTNLTCCVISTLVFHAPNPTVFATARGATLSVVTLKTSSPLSSGSSMTSPTTISTPAITSSSPPLDQTSSPASGSPASPLAIGLGAGLGAAATIAVILGLFFFWRRKAATRSKGKGEPYEMVGAAPVEAGSSQKPMELQRSRSPAELFVQAEAAELPGSGIADRRDEKSREGVL